MSLFKSVPCYKNEKTKCDNESLLPSSSFKNSLNALHEGRPTLDLLTCKGSLAPWGRGSHTPDDCLLWRFSWGSRPTQSPWPFRSSRRGHRRERWGGSSFGRKEWTPGTGKTWGSLRTKRKEIWVLCVRPGDFGDIYFLYKFQGKLWDKWHYEDKLLFSDYSWYERRQKIRWFTSTF